MNEKINKSRQAGKSHAGIRTDQAAAELFEGFSRARLAAWIQDGQLTVDGRKVRPSQKLAGGEWLQLDAELLIAEELIPQEIPLQVIDADSDVIVINKPAGLVVHPAAGHPDHTLLNGLVHFDASLASLPRAGIVHRLDKDTSGIMVVARNLAAHASLVSQLQARTVRRVYEAVCNGSPPPSGIVDAPIGRDRRNRKRMAVTDGGKPAITHFRMLEDFGFAAHLEVTLETGRTHQIRVHMAHIGFPLLGDPLYGPGRGARKLWPQAVVAEVAGLARQALHARTLRFEHPGTGKKCRYEAPLPPDLVQLLETLHCGDKP